MPGHSGSLGRRYGVGRRSKSHNTLPFEHQGASWRRSGGPSDTAHHQRHELPRIRPSVRSFDGSSDLADGLAGPGHRLTDEDGSGVAAAQVYGVGVSLLDGSTGAIISTIPTPRHGALRTARVRRSGPPGGGHGPGHRSDRLWEQKPWPLITAVSPSSVTAGTKTKMTSTGGGLSG